MTEIVDEWIGLKRQDWETYRRLEDLKSLINAFCEEHGYRRLFGTDGSAIDRRPQHVTAPDVERIRTILEPLGVGSVNAALISGDLGKLDLIRSQLDQLWARGHDENGTWVVPNKHRDDGWSDYRPIDPRVPAVTWFTSLDPADADRLTRISGSEGWGVPKKLRVKGNGAGNSENWFGYLHGRNADYPEQVLAINREQMAARVDEIAADDGDPADWDVHHWQDKSPIFTEGLVQTMWGAPLHIYHGGLPLASVRYFDLDGLRPGVEGLDADARPGLVFLERRIDAGGLARDVR
jgi:hypothetical protein